MFLFLLFLIPLLAAGIVIFRKVTSLEKFELLLPAGSILGLTLFTFLLNSLAFILKGKTGIAAAYILTVILGIVFFRTVKANKEKIIFPRGRKLIYWIGGILIWGGFIFWKTGHALIGSDSNLSYAAAATFVKGNFPLFTPWQPDIPLSYHTGASELLGAFYFFSGLDFGFLHLFFSAFFIFCIAQIIIWVISKKGLIAFLLANTATAATLVSFGFIYLVWPVFPLKWPEINSINSLVLWLRNLPNVSNAVEVYGAPINLDALIYFIFHAFGLAIFFALLVLVLNFKKDKSLFPWAAVFIVLAGLALVNESLFVAAFPAVFLGLGKNLKRIIFFSALTLIIVFFQGGVISTSIMPSSLEKSVLILPKKADIKEDFQNYHTGQESPKLLPRKKEWLPLRWLHPGLAILLTLSIPAVFAFRKDSKNALLLKLLFIAGFSSLLAYNFIVPKFLVANGNRFLSASFLFFSLILSLALIWLYQTQKKRILKILIFVLIGWIFIPTILPPLAQLSRTRFGENKLVPKKIEISGGIKWLKEKVPFDKKVLVLDKNAPHPSGQVRALVGAGVFAPVFAGNFRAFTIEASPEYFDAAYYLSPIALRKLKINILLIDYSFYETLPRLRKDQLKNGKYFEKVFKEENSEIIYRIKNEYLENGGEIDGTFEQILTVVPSGKIYIDNEENFDPSYLRRALIFSIRDKDIYYLPQSGVYLNVETNINSHPVREDRDYDYLVLGKNTNPADICKCQANLIWTGLRDQVFLWKVNR